MRERTVRMLPSAASMPHCFMLLSVPLQLITTDDRGKHMRPLIALSCARCCSDCKVRELRFQIAMLPCSDPDSKYGSSNGSVQKARAVTAPDVTAAASALACTNSVTVCSSNRKWKMRGLKPQNQTTIQPDNQTTRQGTCEEGNSELNRACRQCRGIRRKMVILC